MTKYASVKISKKNYERIKELKMVRSETIDNVIERALDALSIQRPFERVYKFDKAIMDGKTVGEAVKEANNNIGARRNERRP